MLETPNEDPLSSQVEGPEQAAPEEETPTEPSEEEEVWVDEPEDTNYEDFDPHAVASTEPSNYILSTEVIVNDQIVSIITLPTRSI